MRSDIFYPLLRSSPAAPDRHEAAQLSERRDQEQLVGGVEELESVEVELPDLAPASPPRPFGLGGAGCNQTSGRELQKPRRTGRGRLIEDMQLLPLRQAAGLDTETPQWL
jgi:hypothetical protein